jgi:hypothetical protein
MQANSKVERDQWIRCLREAASRRPTSMIKSTPNGFALSNDDRVPEWFRNRRLTPDDFNFIKVLGKGNYGKVLEWLTLITD